MARLLDCRQIPLDAIPITVEGWKTNWPKVIHNVIAAISGHSELLMVHNIPPDRRFVL